MSESERSYADKVGKAKYVKEASEGFTPAFNSPNPQDAPAVFGLYITSCEDKNVEIGKIRQNYTNGTVERKNIVKDVKTRAMRSMVNVKSVDAYKPYAKGLEIIYRKLRNYKVPGGKKPSPDAKKRNKGEQSFADIENLYRTFLAGLTAIPAYSHLDDSLKLPALNALYTLYHDKNVAMAELNSTEKRVTAERYAMFYDDTTGLSARMLSVKDAIKNQYGLTSPEYLSVKSIKV
jgi:hypothetical protein